MKVSQAGTGGSVRSVDKISELGCDLYQIWKKIGSYLRFQCNFQIAHALLLSKLHRFKGPI